MTNLQIIWTKNGQPISGPPSDGYNVAYYYPTIADLDSATQSELDAAYLGDDEHGIGCKVMKNLK